MIYLEYPALGNVSEAPPHLAPSATRDGDDVLVDFGSGGATVSGPLTEMEPVGARSRGRSVRMWCRWLPIRVGVRLPSSLPIPLARRTVTPRFSSGAWVASWPSSLGRSSPSPWAGVGPARCERLPVLVPPLESAQPGVSGVRVTRITSPGTNGGAAPGRLEPQACSRGSAGRSGCMADTSAEALMQLTARLIDIPSVSFEESAITDVVANLLDGLRLTSRWTGLGTTSSPGPRDPVR